MVTLNTALAARGLSAKGNLNASTDPGSSDDSVAGYQVGSVWVNSTTGRVWVARNVGVAAAIWTMISGGNPYIVNNWYLPDGILSVAGGANGGIGTLRIHPGFVRHRCTISTLGVRISTTNAGNVQAGFYAHNPATGRPTGNVLASTASMSTASAATVTATASAQVEGGLIWFGVMVDNATAVLTSISNSLGSGMSNLIGSATPANVMSSTGGLSGLAVTGTYGTWPDLTAASFTESTGSSGYGAVQFKVGSVP